MWAPRDLVSDVPRRRSRDPEASRHRYSAWQNPSEASCPPKVGAKQNRRPPTPGVGKLAGPVVPASRVGGQLARSVGRSGGGEHPVGVVEVVAGVFTLARCGVGCQEDLGGVGGCGAGVLAAAVVVVVGGDGGADVGACVCEGFGGGHDGAPFCVLLDAPVALGCGQSGEGGRSTPKSPWRCRRICGPRAAASLVRAANVLRRRHRLGRGFTGRAPGRLSCDPLLTVEGEWLPNPRPPSGGHPSGAPSAPTPTPREGRNETRAPPTPGWCVCRLRFCAGCTEIWVPDLAGRFVLAAVLREQDSAAVVASDAAMGLGWVGVGHDPNLYSVRVSSEAVVTYEGEEARCDDAHQ